MLGILPAFIVSRDIGGRGARAAFSLEMRAAII